MTIPVNLGGAVTIYTVEPNSYKGDFRTLGTDTAVVDYNSVEALKIRRESITREISSLQQDIEILKKYHKRIGVRISELTNS